MGLLDKLWDDTLAGPQPETGLGRLRKLAAFTYRSNSSTDYGGDLPVEKQKLTRGIMIKKPAGHSSPSIGTPPTTPAGTTPPVSPFSGSMEWNRFSETPAMDMNELEEGWQNVPLLLMRCELC